MSFSTSDNISLLSLLCSALALWVALWSVRYARAAVSEARRTSLAANHQKYVELLTDTRRSLEPQLGEFREHASRIYPNILHLLDKFPCRSEGFLRHVAGRYCRQRTDEFSEKIEGRRKIETGRFPISLWEVEMDEPEIPEIKEVVEMVPEPARPLLYRDIQEYLGPYWTAFDRVKLKLEAAVEKLEDALKTSELEEYPVSLSPKIYRRYLAMIRTYNDLLHYEIFQARPNEVCYHDTAGGYEVSTLFYSVSVLMLVERSWIWEES